MQWLFFPFLAANVPACWMTADEPQAKQLLALPAKSPALARFRALSGI
jgi:hypothetical protein